MTVLVCLALAARIRRHMIIVVLCLVCCVRGQSIWEVQWLSVHYEATYISQMAQWDHWLSLWGWSLNKMSELFGALVLFAFDAAGTCREQLLYG